MICLDHDHLVQDLLIAVQSREERQEIIRVLPHQLWETARDART
jgi:hypothetical protein